MNEKCSSSIRLVCFRAFLQTRKLHRELSAEHELTLRELQESSRRLKQDCDHRVALERDKVRLMEEERARLLQQVEARRGKLKPLVMSTPLPLTHCSGLCSAL